MFSAKLLILIQVLIQYSNFSFHLLKMSKKIGYLMFNKSKKKWSKLLFLKV